jgi:hypothetical protein
VTRQRLTVQEAAEALGTSVDAVRMRVRRGSLNSAKGDDGRVYVWLDPDESETKHEPNGESTALISELRAHNATLREQLEAEREANRENRRIIAALTSRIPELEAPHEQTTSQEPPGETEPPTEQPGRRGPQMPLEGAQEPAQRPWWRRVFGG